MVNPKDIDTLSSELESRLDDLFGEDDVGFGDSQDDGQAGDHPLAELKNLVLSIDWEITDEVLESFLQQLRDLKVTYKTDKIVLTFLQILHALGDYIKTNRAKAHPKTFKILNSVFSRLETVVLSKDMTETGKKKYLRAEMDRYKEVRALILRSKVDVQHKTKAKPAKTEKPRIKKQKEDPEIAAAEPVLDQGPVLSIETLAEAVEEIKAYIHAEIKALKQEISLLRKQK